MDISLRLVDYVSDIYQITLVLMFLGCTGAISLGLLMVQMDIVSTN